MLTKDRRHVSTLATLTVTLGSFPAKTAAAAGAALGGGGGEEGAAEGGDADGGGWEIAVGEDGCVFRTHAHDMAAVVCTVAVCLCVTA